MTAKGVAAVVLGLFATVSAAYVVFDEVTRSEPVGTSVEQFEGDHVVVYYFHGNKRCATCTSIEQYAREAIEKGLPEELRSGRIVWRTLNFEDDANASYREEYTLVSSSLVLSDVRDGKQHDSVDLDEVWTLVTDKAAFLKYVESEIRELLESAP